MAALTGQPISHQWTVSTMEQIAKGTAYQAFMRTDLSYLPEHKREELAWIVDMLCEQADVELIVLFGSYARNEWVEDRYVQEGVTYEYLSDYDLLVALDLMTESGRGGKWKAIEDRIRRHPGIKTPVTIVVEGSDQLNRELERGQYFFTDVVKEGVLLFDAGRLRLAEPLTLDPAERAKVARQHFEHWFELGASALDLVESAIEKQRFRDAAFMLHQATERFLFAVILVHTDYKPKSHDIEKLFSQAATWVPQLVRCFPRATAFEDKAFRQLRRAYIDARFDKGYSVGPDELQWLKQQVVSLKDATEAACQERIKSLQAG